MTDFKQKLRGFFSDSSLFRRIYIIDLFFTNIAFLQIPAYVLLVFLFIWGVCLSVYNQRHNNTFFKLRFGIWIGAFLAITVFSMLINFSQTFLYSLLMLLHVVMCFFLFYGMHTEPEFDYRIELYHIAKFIMYATTVMNIIGITCLMFGFKFEWYWIKFTVYENRFTGCYVNPNLLGFISVVSIFCCHILSKGHFMRRIAEKIPEPGISKIWIVACLATNAFSLILCDSNASLVLAAHYVVRIFQQVAIDAHVRPAARRATGIADGRRKPPTGSGGCARPLRPAVGGPGAGAPGPCRRGSPG